MEIRSEGEIAVSSERSIGKWECIAKEPGGGPPVGSG